MSSADHGFVRSHATERLLDQPAARDFKGSLIQVAGTPHQHPDVSRVASPDSRAAKVKTWARRLLGVVINTTFGLALITAVPVGAVALLGSRATLVDQRFLADRVAGIEAARVLMTERDRTITPAQAGAAFAALQVPRSLPTSAVGKALPQPVRPWTQMQNLSQLFPSHVIGKVPNPSWIMHGAREGFNKEQMAALRTIAEAQLWQDYDKVANAPAIDVLGAHHPLPTNATAVGFTSFAVMREYAAVSVSRAAYYMAKGDNARAELALRSVVSFGFAMIDNATNAMDALIGRTIVETGRNALVQFEEITGRDDIARRVVISNNPTWSSNTRKRIPRESLHQQWLADAENERLSRGLRFESLRQLSFSSCGSAKGMLFGPDEATRLAFERATQTLARYPSERALVTAWYEVPSHVPTTLPQSMGPRLVIGAATVAGIALNNPRIPGCTRIAMMNR